MAPEISVVVPTCNRQRRLAQLLTGLRTQNLGAHRFEVIIIDDCSSAATAARIDAEIARGGLEIRVARTEGTRGPARARNIGWRMARAALVAFTDDDCIPVPGWLTAGLEQAEFAPGAIVQGPTEPNPAEEKALSVFSHTVRQAQLGPHYETCNIFYPRALLERLDGFDESFGPGSAGEDTELAWRALHGGATTIFAPKALVYHAIENVGALATLRSARRWTSCVRVLVEHPGTRIMLQRGIFWNVWHYLLLRALLVLFGPAWLRRLILVKYLRTLRARGSAAGDGAWAVPFLILYDILEMTAIVEGAIRYRTWVV